MYNKTILIVIEGIGIRNDKFGNIMYESDIPNLKKIQNEALTSILKTDTQKDVSSSYYGYYTIGAGQDIINDKEIVDKQIESGDFFSNEKLQKLYSKLKEEGKNLHLIGMLSSSQMQSSKRHLNAFLELAKRKDLNNVYIHLILDGIDGKPREAIENIEELESVIEHKEVGQIHTIMGRDFAMNNSSNWEKVKEAYDAIVYSKGKTVENLENEIIEEYMQDRYDRNIRPIILKSNEYDFEDGDAIIFFGHRLDNLEKIIKAFSDPFFENFKTENYTNKIYTMYESNEGKNISYVFERESLKENLLNYLNQKKVRIVEIYDDNNSNILEKRLSNYNEAIYENIQKIVPNVINESEYILNAQKYIQNTTNFVLSEISKENDLIIVDYQALNIVAENGDISDIITTLEEIDRNIGKIIKECEEKNINIMITSTNGKIEEMIDEKTGDMKRSNTNNPVPIYILGSGYRKIDSGNISQISQTLITLLGIEKAKNMKNKSLI